MISRWLSICAVVVLVGCASHDKKSGKGLIVTPGGSLPGTVISVNSGARFAVVRFPIGQMPTLNQHMSAYRQGFHPVGKRVKLGPTRILHVQRVNLNSISPQRFRRNARSTAFFTNEHQGACGHTGALFDGM